MNQVHFEEVEIQIGAHVLCARSEGLRIPLVRIGNASLVDQPDATWLRAVVIVVSSHWSKRVPIAVGLRCRQLEDSGALFAVRGDVARISSIRRPDLLQ